MLPFESVAHGRDPVTDVELRETGSFAVMASLERLGIISTSSLELPVDLSYEDYENMGIALSFHRRQVMWLIGDWVNFGRAVYGTKYEQAESLTGMTYETLCNYASISKKFPPERRRPEVAHSVHAVVASLPVPQQEKWLDRVVANGWSREELRAQVNPFAPNVFTPALGLEEAARDLVRSARVVGDGYLVGRASFRQLCVALGEEP